MHLKLRKTLLIFLSLILALVPISTFSSQKADAASKTVIIGSKNFTENLIIGEIYAQVLSDNGIKVQRKLNLAGTFVAHSALKKGSIDVYPEYTGTGYVDILKNKASHNDAKVLTTLNKSYAKWDLEWLKPTTANNSQALVITSAAAKKYNIKTFSNLAKQASKLRFASTAEFKGRADGLSGLQKAYGGFNFKSTSIVDNGVRYNALFDDKADVTVGFTTDGQLTNKKLVLLTDNKKFYPHYFVAPVIRKAVLKSDPKVKTLLNKVDTKITTEQLQKLNAKVDVDHEKYQTVAKEFIEQNGLK
ncbi:MAG: glycine/betaine ABC transporter substrate-binding protein [Lactobacillus sp.]|jgi:osmoprotectant transport system substrate-binding protein|nr:glycine/betaine ABC transporter substrate-binding protein [Lactobacillus sp.]